MSTQPKSIAILGSTGSIGTQTLEVVDQLPGRFSVDILTAHRNVDVLIAQVKKYRPRIAVIADEGLYTELKDGLSDTGTQAMAGREALKEVVAYPFVDTVVTALVGFAGLEPTVSALMKGKTIALANKETMVVAGELMNQLVKEHGGRILPIDSEHSAIFQCLQGERTEDIEKLILTASGGPFRGYDKAQLESVTKQQALKHPNWDMGAKITIDSATLMNKGLEVIEARWLFDVDPECIEIVVHPQSIVHSMVQFRDGSIKAEIGEPDMRLPIQYALTYPERPQNDFPRTNFTQLGPLTFEPVRTSTFRTIPIAYQAMKDGGDRPCVLNAANEIAVAGFLQDKLRFLDIFDVLENTLSSLPLNLKPKLEHLIETDRLAREIARTHLKK
ncbi:MAG: 1-deoxy-D-xylulose-5-phosphate reductoisomerase [Bacteroidota bacterium]